MYRFVLQAGESGVAFEKACWIWMLQHQSLVALQRYHDLHQKIGQVNNAAQFDNEADFYLLTRIAICLQDDPWAEEWKSSQILAHQHYEFWWTGLDAGEGHAATPMFVYPGSIEELLAETKRAQTALALWMTRFGSWEKESGQQVLHCYATKGLYDLEDSFILMCFGLLSLPQIISSFQRDMNFYTQGIERIREAKVPFVLQEPIRLHPSTVKRDLEEYADFLAFLGELTEVPVVLPKE
jgi:hypothetical protein